jgi:hypothetical protein
MGDGLAMERLDRRPGEAGHAGEPDPILDMHARHPPGLADPEQLRRQEIHLTEEMVVVVGMPEIVVAGGIFVMIAERDRGDDQVDAVAAIRRHSSTQSALTARHSGTLWLLPSSPLMGEAGWGWRSVPDTVSTRSTPELPLQRRNRHIMLQPIGPDDLGHPRLLLLVPLPFVHQHPPDLFLGLGIDQVDGRPRAPGGSARSA